MILTPDGFLPDHSASADDAAIAHVFIRDQLVQPADCPALLPWDTYRELGLVAARRHVIGRHQGVTHVAVALAETSAPPPLPTGWRAGGIRSWFGVLPDTQLAIAMRGVQLLEWERTHRFCGACGSATERVAAERAYRCGACGLSVYPRICPAMMVLITRGREILLARGVSFPPGRYSALAGFLEAGESIEDAIHREVREEVGVEVDDLAYFASQSWPFPNSLMIAFTAKWRSGDIAADPGEIADARWFDIDSLPDIPAPRVSISRALIDATVQRLRDTRA
ncbi:MAG: NAD(+) diphosphatase [Lautropia sp.]